MKLIVLSQTSIVHVENLHMKNFAYLLITLLASCAHSGVAFRCKALTNKLPVSSSQVLVVNASSGISAQITACQRQGLTWHQVFSPAFKGVIGKQGIALVGKKIEGDSKTPVGLYPIGEAFGTEPLALKMDYRYITADDKFVDDVKSNHYNKWVYGKTEANSYENMLIKYYKMGAVINYNMDPIVRGAGSAIFIHIWKSPSMGTEGCVAMSEQHMLSILHWLDKNQHPFVYIFSTKNNR